MWTDTVCGDKVRTTYRFIRDDGEWYYDINSDGRIDEYERDRKNELERSYNYPEIEFLEDGRIMMNTERYLWIIQAVMEAQAAVMAGHLRASFY
ncbi:MAG: hypothetical protein ACLVAV_14325 [Clostridium sp.]